ncbi:S-methyl-5-thioribose kinase [Spirosoma horti]
MHLDILQTGALQDYLRRRGWLDNEEVVASVEIPGEGSMNYTLRVTTSIRSLVVKQSRAYIEKHPRLPAPDDRAIIEGSFYQEIQPIPMLANAMPLLLGTDRENNILVLEDLGDTRAYTFLYHSGQLLSEADTLALTDYLSELHYHFATEKPGPIFTNKGMRLLNHESIFVAPFNEENGLDLDTVQPGLAELAMAYKQDIPLKKSIRQLGQLYLSDDSQPQANASKTLLHGDFYPGSWLQTSHKHLKVINPEFCFYGPAEFDLGILIAHLMLAQQPSETINSALTNYIKPAHFNEKLRHQFTGIELIRRLIGHPQLPFSLSIEQKRLLLAESRQMLV